MTPILMAMRRVGWRVLTLALMTAVAPAPTLGQSAPAGNHLQIGPAALPHLGLQTGLVMAQNIFTREAILTTDITEVFGGGTGSIQFSLGLGAGIRLLGIGRTIGNTGYRGYDLDVGVRFGPALSFGFQETRLSKNQRFSLFAEPFVRFTRVFGNRLFFAETGLHRAALRLGLWVDL